MSAEKHIPETMESLREGKKIIPLNEVETLAPATYGGGPLIKHEGRYWIGNLVNPEEKDAAIPQYLSDPENPYRAKPNPNYKKLEPTHVQLVMEISEGSLSNMDVRWASSKPDITARVRTAIDSVIYSPHLPRVNGLLHRILS